VNIIHTEREPRDFYVGHEHAPPPSDVIKVQRAFVPKPSFPDGICPSGNISERIPRGFDKRYKAIFCGNRGCECKQLPGFTPAISGQREKG
jgi:hypothetical protein